MTYTWFMDIAIFTILSLTFYSLWLGSYPLFNPDEGRYAEIAREMLVTGDMITPRLNHVPFLDKPILHYWLQAFSMKLFGINEWAVRLPPALLGIMGCIVTYICGRRLFNRRTGILSAAILATTPLYFGAAHYANLDLEVAVFISSSLLFFITALQRNDAYQFYFYIAAYTATAFAFLTKGLIGIVFPLLILSVWIIWFRRYDFFKKSYLILGLLLWLIIVLPWYFLVEKANSQFLEYFFVTQQITRFLSGIDFNNKTPFWFYIPIILIGFFPWTIFLLQTIRENIEKIWRTPLQYQTEFYLLLWSAIIFIFFSIPHSKIVGYILPIFPALAILIGNKLSLDWKQPQSSRNSLYYFTATIILSFILFLLSYYQWIKFTPQFFPYLVTMIIILVLCGIIALLMTKKNSLFNLFMICILANIGFLFTLTKSAPYLNTNSTKSLVSQLKQIMRPEDKVSMYFKYYQDAPFYLQHAIFVVADWNAPDIQNKDNWIREFWYGIQSNKKNAYLINEETFWQLYESNQRMFVLLNINYLPQFQTHAKHYFILGRENNILLLSNQPTFLAKNP